MVVAQIASPDAPVEVPFARELLTLLTDRAHPGRGAPELPRMTGSWRAFGQATFRHLLFGVVLGVLVTI